MELPTRFVELYTFTGDLVLDPFMGSGQTPVAALELGRHFVGYEIKSRVRLAGKRIEAHRAGLK